jgi:anaerobic selenocysteine-containing dehydrogenase
MASNFTTRLAHRPATLVRRNLRKDHRPLAARKGGIASIVRSIDLVAPPDLARRRVLNKPTTTTGYSAARMTASTCALEVEVIDGVTVAGCMAPRLTTTRQAPSLSRYAERIHNPNRLHPLRRKGKREAGLG